jgi:PBSX family phage terminase large subunit
MSVPGAKSFWTTNPDSPHHWLKVNYINKGMEVNCRSFHWGIDDNPFLDPEFVDALKREYTGLFKKRFVDGLWVLAEGAIYDMFDDEQHVNLGPPFEPDYYIIGVDYGTGNPTAFVLIAVKHPHNGRPLAWCEREYYYDSTKAMRQKTDHEYALDLKHFIEKREFQLKIVSNCYVDPSAASFKRECEKQGIAIITDADNDVLNGIRTVSTMLYQNRYSIHALAEQTISDYPAYVWDAKKAKRGVEEPVKSDDHTKDAERYALHTHFGEDSILYTPQSMRS